MSKHLAGIIPLANFSSDFGTIFHSSMLPVDSGFTMIQKSVHECALAGCATIWIVANDDLAPIIRKHIGEWVYDPTRYSLKHIIPKNRPLARRVIPIYYVPILPKDRNRRDSYGWSALFGMHSAWWISYRISKWIIPKKYFVSFPHAAYDPYIIRGHRDEIRDHRANTFFGHDGKDIKDDKPMPFAITAEQFIISRRNVNKKTTKTRYSLKEGETFEDLRSMPMSERWSARWFSLSDVFSELEEDGAHRVELDWFHDLRSWDGYRGFLGSENWIQCPHDHLTEPQTDVRIGVQEEEQ